MRNYLLICILIVLSKSSIGQTYSENFYKILLSEYKKMEIKNSAQRDFLMKQIDKDFPNIPNNYKVKGEYEELIRKLKSNQFDDKPVNTSLSSIPIEVIKKFDIEEDKFNKRVILKPKSKSDFTPYLILFNDSKSITFRFKIEYRGDNWLFMDHAIFLINDSPYRIDFKEKVNRDLSASSFSTIKEISDEIVDDSFLDILKKIVQQDRTVDVKLSGEKYNIRKINSKDKENISLVINLYEKLISVK